MTDLRIKPKDETEWVCSEGGALDEIMVLADDKAVLVPRGNHPCVALCRFEVSYLKVIVGPLLKWRFQPDPAVKWIAKRSENGRFDHAGLLVRDAENMCGSQEPDPSSNEPRKGNAWQ